MEASHEVDQQSLDREGDLGKREEAQSTRKSTLRFWLASERRQEKQRE